MTTTFHVVISLRVCELALLLSTSLSHVETNTRVHCGCEQPLTNSKPLFFLGSRDVQLRLSLDPDLSKLGHGLGSISKTHLSCWQQVGELRDDLGKKDGHFAGSGQSGLPRVH